MPAPSANSQLDGLSMVREGMHAGVQPRLLPKDQVAFAINTTFRNGLPRTRPNWRKVTLEFSDSATAVNATQGLWQDGAFYQAVGQGENCLVASVGGRLFRYLPGTQSATVQDISINTTTTMVAGFTIPAVGDQITVNVVFTTGLIPNVKIVIDGANYLVVAIVDASHVTVQNLDGVPGAHVLAGAAVVYTDLNDSQNPNCWMWQAEDFLIVQNGAANPLFFDGGGTRRSLGQAGNELPPGCMGAYVQGRCWMALPDVNQGPSNSYIAGDLVFSHGFNDGYDGRAAVLQTTELSLEQGGGPLSVPVSAGAITGFGTVAVPDTSLGHGALQVHTLTSVFSVNAGFDRTTWFTQNNIQIVVALPNYGTVSQDALVTVNGDSWYRSIDGIRSYQIGRRDQGTWVNTPLSVEVEKIINRDTMQWMGKDNGVLFNNRLLVACSPFQVLGRGTAWRGLVALDFNNISNLTTRSQPCYDGLWTGVAILKVVKGTFKGRERCFAWALGCDGEVELWELVRDDAEFFDWDGSKEVPVEGAVETRAMGWNDGGNRLKRLQTCDLYLDKVAGADNVLVGLKYRSDEDPLWKAWPVCAGAEQATLCAPARDCAVSLCEGFEDVYPQYATYLRWNDPPDTPCSAVTARSPRTGYEFQVRLSFSGFIQLNRLHAWAEPINDSVRSVGVSQLNCVLLRGCEEPWFGYTVNGCRNVPPLPPGGGGSGGGVPSITNEPGQPITDQGGTPIRTEDQDEGTPVPPAPPTPVGPPSPHVPPNVPPPVWPVPDPYPCPGRDVFWQLPVADLGTTPPTTHNVGIADPGGDPAAYITGLGFDANAVIQAWANAVWLQFVTTGTPYSQARLIWLNVPDGGRDWLGYSVFPDGVSNFGSGLLLDLKIAVEFCP